jgi:hypothetical protein
LHFMKQKKVKAVQLLGGEEVQLLLISDLSTRWVSGHRHAPAVFYPWGEEPRYPFNRRPRGPQPVRTQRLEEKSFRLCRDSNLDCPVSQSTVRHYTEWATPLIFFTISINLGGSMPSYRGCKHAASKPYSISLHVMRYYLDLDRFWLWQKKVFLKTNA